MPCQSPESALGALSPEVALGPDGAEVGLGADGVEVGLGADGAEVGLGAEYAGAGAGADLAGAFTAGAGLAADGAEWSDWAETGLGAEWAETADWVEAAVSAGSGDAGVSPEKPGLATSTFPATLVPGFGARSSLTLVSSRSWLLSATAAPIPPVATTAAMLPVTIQARLSMVSSLGLVAHLVCDLTSTLVLAHEASGRRG